MVEETINLGMAASCKTNCTVLADRRFPLACMLRELLSELGDFFTGWRPVRVACIAVEYKCVGLQRCLEFLSGEGNCLVVIVRADGIEFQAVAHERSFNRAVFRGARTR